MTDQKRLEVYKRTFKHYSSPNPEYGICYHLIWNSLYLYDEYHICYTNIFSYFPELEKYRPENKELGDHWFSLNSEGNKKRIEILNEIITELENKIKPC
jgi:hypothetical protein